MKIWSTCLFSPEMTLGGGPASSATTSVLFGQLLAQRRAEVGDERDVLLAQRLGHGLEVEVGAVGLAGRDELDRLRDELLLGLLVAQERLHLGEVVPAEQLERRDDAHAARMGGVGDRDRVLADERGVAEAALVEVAVGLDADAEERDRREQPVVEALRGAVVQLPVGEIAVDLVGQARRRGWRARESRSRRRGPGHRGQARGRTNRGAGARPPRPAPGGRRRASARGHAASPPR